MEMRSFFPQNNYAVSGSIRDGVTSTFHYRNIKCLTDNNGQICGTFPEFPTCLTLRELFDEITDRFHDKHLFGSMNENMKEFEWISYGDFSDLVKSVASSLIERGVKEKSVVCIIAENSVWFALAYWAIVCIGAILVPIEVTMSKDIVIEIIDNYACNFLVCTPHTFPLVFGIFIAEVSSTVKTIFVSADKEEFNQLQIENQSELFSISNIPIVAFCSFFNGRVKELNTLPPLHAESVCAYNVGNGTGGSLNAAILTHSNCIAAAVGLMSCCHDFNNDIYYSTISCAKPVERSIQLVLMAHGGAIGFSSGPDFDAMSIIQPTVASFVPATLESLAESIIRSTFSSNFLGRTLLRFCISVTAQAIEGSQEIPWFIRSIMIEPLRKKLGGRLKLIMTSNSYLEPRIKHLVKTLLMVDIVQIYGTSETCGVISINHVDDPGFSTVGPPATCCEVRLRDFVEGDMIVCQNEPGEIMVRGPNVFQGYYKNRQLSIEKLSGDGWFSTGDLGRIRPNGTIELIDTIFDWRNRRKNNV